MAIIRISRPPMLTPETYDAVNEHARVVEEPPQGMLMHCLGQPDGVWQIVDVWEAAEQAERFDSERLMPAIRAVVGTAPPDSPPPAPQVTSYELRNLILP